MRRAAWLASVLAACLVRGAVSQCTNYNFNWYDNGGCFCNGDGTCSITEWFTPYGPNGISTCSQNVACPGGFTCPCPPPVVYSPPSPPPPPSPMPPLPAPLPTLPATSIKNFTFYNGRGNSTAAPGFFFAGKHIKSSFI